MKKRIIISGGGIAGLAAARFLHDQGHEVTVIDKAKEFTKAGFLLSLKSFGVKIMEELGLAQALLEAATPSGYMNFVDASSSLIRKVSYAKINEGVSQPIVITRGGLHHVLYQAIKDSVNIRMQTSIQQVQQDAQKVTVTLSDGNVMEADLLIVSEGLRSATREKYFENSQVQDFNVFYVGGRLQESHPYKVGTFTTFIDINKMLSIYPVTSGEVAIQCYIYNTGGVASLQNNTQHLLRESFLEYNAEVQELIGRFLHSGQIYADKMGMVLAPALANGRMVLLGDAGYCPTAPSGMGASLSIYGAKALAHFIKQSPDDIALSLKNYHSLLQPIAEKFQSNARNNAASFLPQNEASLQSFKSSFSTASEASLQKKLTEQLLLTDDQLHFRMSI